MALTPFEIHDLVLAAKAVRSIGGDLAELRFEKMKQTLYITVLKEIAAGCIDPRSLAMAVVELEEA